MCSQRIVSLSLSRDLRTEALFWFCGRHRFLTYFIQRVLYHGPDESAIRDVIANIRFVAAGSLLPPGIRNLNLHIPSLIPLSFPLLGVEGRPSTCRESESVDVKNARNASLLYLTTGILPSYEEEDMRKLVELGIARFVHTSAGGSVTITERLVHAALVNYFNDPRNPENLRTTTDQMLRMKVGMAGVGGYGLELSMVHLFANLFGHPDGVLLSDVFDFDATIKLPKSTRGRNHYTPAPVPLDYTPPWASYRARLLGNFAIKRKGGPHLVNRDTFASPLATIARTFEETLAWFRNMCRDDGQAWPPFLLPDHYLGPDGVCGLELTDPMDPSVKLYLLALLSCKNWSTPSTKKGTPRVRGGPEVRHAMFTMSPEGLFSTLPSEDTRRKAQAELHKYLSVFEPLPGVKQPKTPDEVASLVTASVTTARQRFGLKPLAPSNKNTNEIAHSYDNVVRFGAMRCLASYPETVKLPYITTAEGLYPFATLTEKVMERAAEMGFTTYSEALLRVRSRRESVEGTSGERGEESAGPVTIPAADDPSQLDLEVEKYDAAAILQDYGAGPVTASAAYPDAGFHDQDGGDYQSLFDARDDEGAQSGMDEMSVDAVEDEESMLVDSPRGTPTGRKRQASPPASGNTPAAKRRAVGP
ncbi:hypothetical protein AURDEDRAFT_168876 [Auricularia subglabra TFB-10046 SS5]|nr:hypothetical protein AURDEDRAFT_168876 [Auricularia subglabra TFB-10046 SS5]